MRIFVCVGTGLEPFNRLIQTLDSAIELVGIDVSGLCQTGSCTHNSHHLANVQWIGRSEFRAAVATADAVVCHGGVGTLHTAIRAGHVPYVMARRAEHCEVVNDHQVEIIAALAERQLVRPFDSATELAELLRTGPRRQSAGRLPAPLAAEIGAALGHGPSRARFRPGGWWLLRALTAVGPGLASLRYPTQRN